MHRSERSRVKKQNKKYFEKTLDKLKKMWYNKQADFTSRKRMRKASSEPWKLNNEKFIKELKLDPWNSKKLWDCERITQDNKNEPKVICEQSWMS